MNSFGPSRTAVGVVAALGAFCLLTSRLCFAGGEAVSSGGQAEGSLQVHELAEGFVQLVDRVVMLDVWTLTRQSSAVVEGTVTSVTSNVLLNVTNVFKGSAVPPTVAFPHPPVPSLPRGKMALGGPKTLKFVAGESWLVFLKAGEANTYVLLDAVQGDTSTIRQAVKDVLEFDSLADGRTKCLFLIGLVNSSRAFSAGPASQELEKFNTPDNLPLFAGLAGTNIFAMRTYANLLRENTNPESVPILRRLLKTDNPGLLLPVMEALARKDAENAGISKDLLGFLGQTNPVVRASAISLLNLRGYSEAFPRIVQCLDDPEPSVRIAALSWPWYAHRGSLGEVLPRIRELACDAREEVRASACLALVQARDLGSFYPLWFKSVFDSSTRVRGTPGLDLLLEHAPLVCLALLLWPTLVALGAAWVVTRRFPPGLRLLWLLSGALGGYILGACAGYFVGACRSTNPLTHSLILEPAVAVPLAIIAVAFLASRCFRSPST